MLTQTTNQTQGNQNGGEPGNNTQPATDATNTGNGATGTNNEQQQTPVTFTAEQQTAIDKLINERIAETARKTRESVKTELQKQRDTETAAAEQAKLVEQGKWKEVADGHVAKISTLEAEVTRLNGEIATKEVNATKLRIATKYSLPAGSEIRLQGNTEAEIEADAKAFAATLKLPTAPNLENQRTNQRQTLYPVPSTNQDNGQPLSEIEKRNRQQYKI